MRISYLMLMGLIVISCKQADLPAIECFDYSPLTIEDCSIETQIQATTCILREVISDGGGQKWVYSHNGVNYDHLERFDQSEGVTTPLWTMDFEYDGQNRISQANKSDLIYGTTTEINFNYVDQPFLIITHLVFDSNQNLVFNSSQEYPYYPLEKDSLYLIESNSNFMMGFEGGNRTTFYEEDPSSTCSIYNYTWIKTSEDYYDQRPNVFSDYAVLQSSAFPEQIWFWGNENNLIGGINPNDPNAELGMLCSEYLTNTNGDYWIKRFVNRTYYYECEN